MSAHDPIKSHVPIDRLSHLADEMMKPLDRPENQDVKGMVFLHDKEKGTIGIHGYEGDDAGMEAVVDLFVHMKAVFEAHGKSLDFMALGDDGVSRA